MLADVHGWAKLPPALRREIERHLSRSETGGQQRAAHGRRKNMSADLWARPARAPASNNALLRMPLPGRKAW